MMKAFLKSAATQRPNLKIAISERFLGDDGKPIPWELSPVSEKIDGKIRNNCFDVKMDSGKSKTKFEKEKYLLSLCAAAVVFPDLRDAELQASYGVVGEENRLSEMLLAGEFDRLANIVQTLNGYDKDAFEEIQNAVKNS